MQRERERNGKQQRGLGIKIRYTRSDRARKRDKDAIKRDTQRGEKCKHIQKAKCKREREGVEGEIERDRKRDESVEEKRRGFGEVTRPEKKRERVYVCRREKGRDVRK